MTTRFETVAGGIYDAIRPRLTLLVVLLALLAGASAALLPTLPLDMSFRPLFKDAGEDAATERFEAEFGQASGRRLLALVEPDAGFTEAFLDRMEGVCAALAAAPDLVDVACPTRLVALAADANGFGVARVPRADWWPAAEAAGLLSSDGRTALVTASVDIPLADLAARRPVIEAFERIVREGFEGAAKVHVTGVSVVEASYAELVLEYLAVGIALTVVAVFVLLWLRGTLLDVVVTFAGVAVGTPIALAVLELTGGSMTIINSMVPTMILIIGIADAVHLKRAFRVADRPGTSREAAVREMVVRMALPCLTTTATTIAGALALLAAEIAAIRSFGAYVAVGVAIVWLTNQLLIPWLLLKTPAGRSPRRAERSVSRPLAAFVVRRPRAIVGAFAIATVAAVALVPRLEFDQKFNAELAADHPVVAAQRRFEADFGGFLGPELHVTRGDGGSVVDPATLARLDALAERLRRDPDVLKVDSIAPTLRAAESLGDRAAALAALRQSPLASEVAQRVNAAGTGVAILVRTTDMGSERAHTFVPWVEQQARLALGPDYEVAVVGQWWLAQRGMQGIVRDMTASFAFAFLMVVPMLALSLKRVRLLAISLLPNLLPALAALAFMAAAGISVRIGTAMVLAIALGIAVDDSVHMLTRLRRELDAGAPLPDAVKAAVTETGPALILTTLALLAGFASMLTNDLLAIRDMGLVAAVAIATALAADLLLLPALALWPGAMRRRQLTEAVPAAEAYNQGAR